MKTAILVLGFVILVLAAMYLFPMSGIQKNTFEPVVLESGSYSAAMQEISQRINDLSPTPPTEQTWTVREVEFVKNEPYAYVVYHDTHNIFRILLETGRGNTFRTAAAFEADSQGWRVIGGEDLAKGKETVKINPN